ncbi:MAG: ABC transporter permease subunit [Alphaproteobacteria bacterium]|nr:ABC transporter permease subunit [Alphaproteobacteria bacterium]
MIDLVINATSETLTMVGIAGVMGVLLGVPLGLFLYLTRKGNLMSHAAIHGVLGLLTNLLRSIPYIILIVLLIPLSRILTGSSIGLAASIVPLSLASILLTARMAEDAFKTVAVGLIETGIALGAAHFQIVSKIILPESLPALTSGMTNVLIMLVGFSAMSGAVGGGGLGDLAIRYGYQRYDMTVLIIIVAILIGFVQLIQMAGDRISKKITH